MTRAQWRQVAGRILAAVNGRNRRRPPEIPPAVQRDLWDATNDHETADAARRKPKWL